tara:strand:+ start:324 stop:716 length:393 start_codon:yes stop_codon:yes gene_type:complete
MNDRLKNIDNILKNLPSQKEWKENLDKKINSWFKKYPKELEDYEFVYSLDQLRNQVKAGGYIRYFNNNEELRYGGFLVRKIEEDDNYRLSLMNMNGKKWTIVWSRNYIFYKKHTTANDKLRKIFISLLDD